MLLATLTLGLLITTVTVTVPLEHGENHRKNSQTAELMERSTQIALSGLKARIISNRSTPTVEATREEQLVSTAFTMAVTSLEKSCRALELRMLGRHSADCDVNFIFETDFEYSVRAQDNDDHQSHLSNKPCIVICNSNPSGKTVKASRDKEVIRMGAAVEYIAMPCGVKTIARAITSALLRQKELDATPARRNGESLMSAIPGVERIDLGDMEVPPSIHPIISPQEVAIRPAIRSSQSFQESERMRAGSLGKEGRDALALGAKPAEHGPINEQQGNGISILANSPKTAAPTLLLVDDNKVNLQLLTMYAKKRGYPYLSATDGQMAVNAYQKSHEDSSLPNGDELATSGLDAFEASHQRSVETTDAGKVTVEIPSVILMDINMPVMDGYEATQHIRTYEKKHSLPPATIIALTALGSEAAYQEAFGSGCDMFLTKPVKLKDLTKIIEDM